MSVAGITHRYTDELRVAHCSSEIPGNAGNSWSRLGLGLIKAEACAVVTMHTRKAAVLRTWRDEFPRLRTEVVTGVQQSMMKYGN